METNDLITVYVSDTLNQIKDVVKKSINLEKEREKQTDEKMSKVLYILVNTNVEELEESDGILFHKLLPLSGKEENERVWTHLILYYTALYFDNVALLQKMLSENVFLGKSRYDLLLCVLDKNLSSRFEEQEYLELIKNSGNIFKMFYCSIKKVDSKERENYFNRFAKILKGRKDELNLKKYNDISFILVKNNLDVFDNESYLNSSIEQLRKVIGHVYNLNNKDNIKRLNNLIHTTDFAQSYWDWDLMFSLFTDEELLDKDYWVEKYFEKAKELGIDLQRAIRLYNREPNIVNKDKCMNPSILAVFDDDTIIEFIDYINEMMSLTDNIDIIRNKVAVKKLNPKRLVRKRLEKK
jgi:hypothetical protein